MKKILLALVLLVVIMLVAAYLFIPRKLKIEATTTVNAALPAVSRLLSENDTWKKFWPDTAAFKLNDQTYSIKGKFFTAFNIDIGTEKDSISSILNLLLLSGSDPVAINWSGELIISSGNPFTRISQYRKARSIEKNMNSILTGMKNFMEQTKNIYGFDIKQTKVKDSVLISTRRSFDHHPASKDVYEMIQSLKEYIAVNDAKEEGPPMLNIFQTDSLHFEAMTAIPVDRKLPLTNIFAPKFLLKGGDILEAEVNGGYYKIGTALKELENYKNDYRFYSPAIPYQLLITDRSKEPDTTKWITRLYYPVN
jgi:hypothetical protein